MQKNKKGILWILGIALVGIYGYNLYILIPRLVSTKQIPHQSPVKKSEKEKEKFIIKKIPYEKMNPRNIFLPPDFKPSGKTRPIPSKHINNYELNGIIPDKNNPTAILVNTKTKNTIIVTIGQLLDDGKTKLIEIKDNHVIIEKENKRQQLQIKR